VKQSNLRLSLVVSTDRKRRLTEASELLKSDVSPQNSQTMSYQLRASRLAAGLRRGWALPLLLLLLLLPVPAAALDALYLVRHAEKVDDWPAAPELDAFRPLSPAGVTRAEALAIRLRNEGIAAAYTSRTTRCIATAEPLAKAARIPIVAEDASTHPSEMADFLAGLRQKHAGDRAVLIVGHSNTIPELLLRLGAKPECLARLGITGQPGSLLIEGYDGLWRVDLKKQGCEAIAREVGPSH
jgi:broad specificity phosphatase PhoE